MHLKLVEYEVDLGFEGGKVVHDCFITYQSQMVNMDDIFYACLSSCEPLNKLLGSFQEIIVGCLYTTH